MDPLAPARVDLPTCERWRRLQAHRFEDSAAGLDFTRRLAREQRWTLDQARAAIEEYRRYCWLQSHSSTSLTPSEAVDQVWHLHLTYTHDYWERWCGVALRRPLHHQPTQGGAAQARTFRAQYAETLARYEAAFGPPAERWWPSTQARFADARRWRWVDTTQHWVLPRPGRLFGPVGRWVRRGIVPAAVMLALGLLTPLAYGMGWNPWGWDAETFLTVYLLGGILLLAWQSRQAHLRLDAAPASTSPGPDALTPLTLAALAEGPARVREVVVTTALQQGAVVLDAQGRLQRGSGEVPDEALELTLAAGRMPQGLSRAGLVEVLQPVVDRTLAQGTALGLLHELRRLRQVLAMTCLPLWLWLGFGVSRIVQGLQRERPVGWLLVLVGVLLVLTLVRRYGRSPLTTRGRLALAHAQQRHARLRRAPRDNELPLAVALVGTSILVGTAWAQWHRPPGSDGSGGGDSGSSSSSDDSSSSDGGGGSGCGGCGGGGD